MLYIGTKGMVLMKLKISDRQSIRSRIAGYYRDRIISGRLKYGDVIPSARKLASEFGTAEANVHHAIAALVKEGLVMRRPKIGSVVTKPENKLSCVAIFLNWHHIQRGENFTRILVEMVENELKKHGIDCIVIYDTPSQNGLEQLRKMANSRQIQGIIVRSAQKSQIDFFSRLPVPFTAISKMRIPNKVNFFTAETAEIIFSELKKLKTSKLGIISIGNMRVAENNDNFVKKLHELAAGNGIRIKSEWIYDSADFGSNEVIDSSAFAYHGFRKIWSAKERPDTLLAFSDDMVSGLAMAFYSLGVKVPDELRLVIHKTVENPIIFPFPCTLIENSIAELAELMVGQLMDQAEGHRPRKAKLRIFTSKSGC